MGIDFSEYNLEELILALESVDDFKYPDNVLTIYKRVLKQLDLDYKNVDSKSLGYDSDEFSESFFSGLICLPVGGFAFDQNILNAEMRDKINRLNSRLAIEARS